MKASVKLRRDQDGLVRKKPIVKAKFPFDFLGFPFLAGFTVCGHIQELALRLCFPRFPSPPPSLQLSFRPHNPDHPFSLSLSTCFSPWPSSPASSLTIAAEFNLSHLSNPTFLLKVKPHFGDFSFRHDFHSRINGGGSIDDRVFVERHGSDDGSSSDMSFTNTFARYAPRIHLPDNASLPWHDSLKIKSCDAEKNDTRSSINIASYDSTPYASERTSFARLDFTNYSSEHSRPLLQVFTDEKSFQDLHQDANTDTEWGLVGDDRNLVHSNRPQMDDDWERVGDGHCGSTTSSSCSTQQRRRIDDIRVQHHHPQSVSSSAGWRGRGFFEGSRLGACTRLPISSEAHVKIRWSVSAGNSSSSVPLLPLLLLDKVSLEAGAPRCAGAQNTPSHARSKAFRHEALKKENRHLKGVENGFPKNAREDRRLEDGPDYAGFDTELKPMSELHVNDVNTRKISLLDHFLHGKGLLD